MTRTFVVERSLRQRILAEYQELPTLRLSVRQAARLWNVELENCQQTLDLLVAEGWLSRSARNEYCGPQDRAATPWSLAAQLPRDSAA